MRADRRRVVGFLAVLLCAGVLGCKDATGPASLVNVSTTGSHFQLSEARDDGVPFTVENRGMRVVYLARCGNFVMPSTDRLVGTEWAQYSAGICKANLPSTPLALEPGERYEGTVSIVERGSYRFRIGVAPDIRSEFEWSGESNSFSVE